MERCEDWIHYHIEVNREIQTHVKYNNWAFCKEVGAREGKV